MSLIVLCGVAASTASAHTLDIATARLSLREGHLEIYAELDLLALIPTIDRSTLSDVDLRRAAERLGATTRLTVDGREIAVSLGATPAVSQVRQFTAEGHGRLLPVRLEAATGTGELGRLDVAFPPEVGPVLVTLVQPRTRLAPPGGTVGFEGPSKPSHPWQRGLAIGSALLALAALLVTWRRSHRPE